jgi:uncharacterized protein (TIGR00297 family)
LLLQVVLAFIFASIIAYTAYRARALNQSGAVAAAALGTVVFGIGGLEMAILLVAFFVTSSALSRLFGRQKRALDEKFSKGSQRDAAQVLANGGVTACFILIGFFFPGAHWPQIAAAAALAAANADTWATELGVLNPTRPVLITNGQPVERGTSGGISRGGTLAAAGGAGLIALLAALTPPQAVGFVSFSAAPLLSASARGPIDPVIFVILTISGLAGSLVDSLLGATLQTIYRCPACNKETERHPLHSCGARTRRVRGLHWLNNDMVNALCTLSAALFAILLSALFTPL